MIFGRCRRRRRYRCRRRGAAAHTRVFRERLTARARSKESTYLIAIYPEQPLFRVRARRRVSFPSQRSPAFASPTGIGQRGGRYRFVVVKISRFSLLPLPAFSRSVIKEGRRPRERARPGDSLREGVGDPHSRNFHIQIVLDIERMYQPNARRPTPPSSKRLRKIDAGVTSWNRTCYPALR